VGSFQGAIAETLHPLQLGVATPQATEIVAHAVRAWAQCAPSDEAVLLVDFANAFNSLDRQKMLETIFKDAPEFAQYASFCYGGPTPLVCSGFQILSEEGTQQGDVCGPLFFAVTLQRILLEACPDLPGRWCRSYLDDITLCGKTPLIEAAFEKLRSLAPSIGLQVNNSKCCLWGPSVSHFDDLQVTPWHSGIKVLGVPVGSDQFI
jgi:hypothetical protein